jgi:hypothetical protein
MPECCRSGNHAPRHPGAAPANLKLLMVSHELICIFLRITGDDFWQTASGEVVFDAEVKDVKRVRRSVSVCRPYSVSRKQNSRFYVIE